MSRGKAFESELKKSLEAAGCLAHRIKDSVIWNGRVMVGQETPADLYCFSNVSGTLSVSLIECKAVNGKSIPFDRVEQHQLDSLLAFESYDENCHGFVAVNFYDKENVRKFNVAYMINIRVWQEYAEHSDRKSLPLSSCVSDSRIIECPRAAKSMFDMSAWVKFI